MFDVQAAPYHAAGDGTTLDTEAIRRAVDDASRVGGTVLLREGRFLVSGIDLRSNVTLWIDPSAVIQGHEDFTVYPVRRHCESLIAVKRMRRGVLYGERVKNVRILGGCMIEVNGRCRFKVNNSVQPDGSDVRLLIVQVRESPVPLLHAREPEYSLRKNMKCTRIPLD